MSRFEINSWVRKKIKQMSGDETCPRIKTSAKQISFWFRKLKFIDKCRIMTIQRCFVAKTNCLRAFLGHIASDFWCTKKGRSKDLPQVSPIGVNIGLKV